MSFSWEILTGKETWVPHFEPWFKRLIAERINSEFLRKKTFKIQLSAEKVIFTVTWKVNEPKLGH